MYSHASPVSVRDACLFDAEGLPADEPAPDPRLNCVPDPKKGISCEPAVRIRAPVKLGPRTTLYDMAFEGNRILIEQDLADKADLELGGPVSQTEIEAARHRVLDAFKEEGFAFAEVRALLDFSADRTRARVRFIISEGERVYVDGIVVRGAKRTNPALIMRRVSFERCPRDKRIEQCEPYRASDVRKSEERIATLGTFSSVSISLEDPQVPAKRKVVIIEVQERVPQYLDLARDFRRAKAFAGRWSTVIATWRARPSSSRCARSSATCRTPSSSMTTCRENFDTTDRFRAARAAQHGLDCCSRSSAWARSSAWGSTASTCATTRATSGSARRPALATLTYRPARSFYAQLGGSLERNDVQHLLAAVGRRHFELAQSRAKADLSRLLRVPDGLTFAFAQRLSVTWDCRDNPFGATKGTLAVAASSTCHASPPPADNPTITN